LRRRARRNDGAGDTAPQNISLRDPLNIFEIPGSAVTVTDKPQDASSSAGEVSALEHSRFLLSAIVDSSDDAIISKSLDGIIMSWNNAACKIFGYLEEEITGRSILTLIPTELHGEEDEILRNVRAGKRIEHYETTRLRKDGTRIRVSVTISPIKDFSGRVIGASKIARDVSNRSRTDEARFRLAAIVDSSDDAIISKDLNGIIMTWNASAARLFGYSTDEIVGQPVLTLIPPELHYEEEEILQRLRAGERIEHYETKRRRKNGETIHVSVSISPIRDNEGRLIGGSKIVRDISDRKKLEQLVIQSEKLAATGRMAAAIAHEINNPLESLVNLIYLARKSCAGNEKGLTYLLTAEKELERVSHIARQTLGYYRDTGSPKEVHLHDLLDNVLAVYNSRLVAKGIVVENRFNDLRKILVSQGEMLQVFSNIIVNAIDAMTAGGTLSIQTRNTSGPGGNGIQIAIRDQGIGIEPDHMEKVFEPFFTTKGNLGTGIGLWVAKQLVERHSGQISITSNTERGRSGTVVSIFLPFEQQPSQQSGATGQTA
jgi:PAS domain S-box-containing protein